MVLRVKEHRKPEQLPLEAVAKNISEHLAKEKATAELKTKADKLIAGLRDGSIAADSVHEGQGWKTYEAVTRGEDGIDPAELHKLRRAECAMIGDLRELLPAMSVPTHCEDWLKHCVSMKQQHGWRYDHPGERIFAPLMLKQLSERMPDNAVVCCDVGQHQMVACRYAKFNETRSNVTSGGLGTMGFALPAAIGAKFGAQDRTVIAVIGDGGIQQVIGRRQLHLVVARDQRPVLEVHVAVGNQPGQQGPLQQQMQVGLRIC